MVRTGDKSWFGNQCVLPLRSQQRAYRVWSRSRKQTDWEEYRVARRYTQHVYVEVERAFNERGNVLLSIASNPRNWWSTVKMAVFGVSSSFLPLLDGGGRLIWSAEEKASLFSAHFDAKQCKNSFQ